jgi:hypothetical protein
VAQPTCAAAVMLVVLQVSASTAQAGTTSTRRASIGPAIHGIVVGGSQANRLGVTLLRNLKKVGVNTLFLDPGSVGAARRTLLARRARAAGLRVFVSFQAPGAAWRTGQAQRVCARNVSPTGTCSVTASPMDAMRIAHDRGLDLLGVRLAGPVNASHLGSLVRSGTRVVALISVSRLGEAGAWQAVTQVWTLGIRDVALTHVSLRSSSLPRLIWLTARLWSLPDSSGHAARTAPASKQPASVRPPAAGGQAPVAPPVAAKPQAASRGAISPPTVKTSPPAVTTSPPAVTTSPPAVTTSPPAVASSPPAAAPSLWVSPTGSDADCSRGNVAHPCATFNQAVKLAQCGDTVQVADGAYPSQTIAFQPSKLLCNGNYVTFVPSGNVGVAALSVMASWLRFQGLHRTLNQLWAGGRGGFDVAHATVGFGSSGPPNDVGHDYFQDVNFGTFSISGAHDLTMQGGQMGPVDHAGCPTCQDIVTSVSQMWTANAVYPAHDNTFDGVFIHDNYDSSGAANPGHTDCIQTDGYMNLTIKNTVFLNCADEDIIVNIFSTTASNYATFVSAGWDPLAGGDFENNWFTGGRTTQPVQLGSPAGADWSQYRSVCTGVNAPSPGCSGDHSALICHNLTFRNNTVVAGGGGDIVGLNCAAGATAGAISAQRTVHVTGNIVPSFGTSCAIAMISYNYYTGSVCSLDSFATAGSLLGAAFLNPSPCYGYNSLCVGVTATPYNFHLGASSGARGKGSPLDFPATDIDGLARLGPADAGAARYR